MLYILLLLFSSVLSPIPNLNIHGGTGGAGEQGGEQGGGGGSGEGPVVNVGSGTMVINHGNKEDGLDAPHLAFLDWFSPINCFQRHADISQVRAKGTGGWLLVDPVFKKWESSSGSTLWCHGIRAGKTVLASMVVDHLGTQFRGKNIGVACIYLNHKEVDSQPPSRLLAGLWRQLVLGRDIGSIVDKFKQHREKGTAPSLEEVVTVLSSSLKEFSQVFIIVDAMDEYPKFQRNILLQQLAAMGSNVNIMITSRPNISLESFSLPNLDILDIHAVEDNLRKYVDAQIDSSPRLSMHVQRQPALQEEIHSKINIQTVDGMFLLAKLHIQSLSTKNTIQDVRDAMKELPKSLDDSYDIAMQRIEAQSEDDRKTARSILIWVANAKRPLKVSETIAALSIKPGDKRLNEDNFLDIKIILSVCAGLVIVDKESSVVRLVHYTTQEYLDKIQAKKFSDAQTEITCTLLTFLAFDGYPESSWESENLPPLVEYSQYCLAHAAGQPEENNMGLLAMELSAFLSQPSALWIAVAANLVETTKFLLEGAPLPQHSKIPEIIAASYYGHMTIVCILLEKGANINAAGGFHGSSLQAAASGGHTEIVRILLEKGADDNAAGGLYWSSLQVATDGGHTEIVRILLEKRADDNAAGVHNGSSLQVAAARGHTEIVRILLEKGADVNAAGGQHGSSLQAAAAGGHTEIVHILVEKGAIINAAGGEHGSSLQAAAAEGHTEIVRILLENGANINAAGGEHGSSLQAAAAEGHPEIVHVLLEQGPPRTRNFA
ncbi:ankyrin repeat-containing domain protein [Mycena rebaudengoi]|nr:ankyrin repeat-containing domain protein [Mycena rebaudengoi]